MARASERYSLRGSIVSQICVIARPVFKASKVSRQQTSPHDKAVKAYKGPGGVGGRDRRKLIDPRVHVYTFLDTFCIYIHYIYIEYVVTWGQ